jgi:hypothetical protein
MSDESRPIAEPGGALVPTPDHPPTALAAPAALPSRRRDEPVTLGRLVDSALDVLDALGDSIAGAVGLR